jgi:hypothetical protein
MLQDGLCTLPILSALGLARHVSGPTLSFTSHTIAVLLTTTIITANRPRRRTKNLCASEPGAELDTCEPGPSKLEPSEPFAEFESIPAAE